MFTMYPWLQREAETDGGEGDGGQRAEKRIERATEREREIESKQYRVRQRDRQRWTEYE